MANQYKNKVIYGNQTLMDITDTTATENDVLEGEVFYSASGARSVGTLSDATTTTHGLMSAADKIKLDGIDLLGVKLNTTTLTPDANGYVSIPLMTGATSSTDGTAGLIPAPTSADREKFFRGDGTWQDGGKPMVILSYGNSTWNDFITAYNNKVIVYCRASSNSNPATGSQTRMAFMAYVNNADNPTNVEFQYYRSVNPNQKSASQMSDQVFVYTLTNANGGTWSVTTRQAGIQSIAAASGSKIGVSYSNSAVTLSNTMTADDMPMSSSDATTAKAAIDALNSNITGKADKVSGATNGNFAGLDANGNLVDSGKSVSDFAEYEGYISEEQQSIATFNAKNANNLMRVEIGIEPVQDLHGYDHPWPAGGGKNLLPMTVSGIKLLNTTGTWSGNTYSINNITVTILVDSDNNVIGIKLNGTANAITFFAVTNDIDLQADTVLNGCPSDGNFDSGYALYLYQGGDTRYKDEGSGISIDTAYAGCGCNIIVRSGVNVNNKIFYPMIRSSSDSSSFAPYSNICPITGWTEAKVTRTGKNLLKRFPYDSRTEADITGVVNSDGSITITGTASGIWWGLGDTGNLELKPGTYTLSQSGSKTGIYLVIVRNGSYFSEINGNGSITFTVSDGDAFSCYITVRNGTVTNTTVYCQLEKGSVATEYEPYAGHEYQISFPSEAGTVYGGTLTVNKDGTGKLVVDRKGINLGNVTWDMTSVTQGTLFRTTAPNSDLVYGSTNYIVSNYRVVHASSRAEKTSSVGSNGSIDIIDSDYGDATAFKTAMSGQTAVYSLATPITYDLTAPQIATLLGMNNVWADTGDILSLAFGEAEECGTDLTLITTGERYEWNKAMVMTANDMPMSASDATTAKAAIDALDSKIDDILPDVTSADNGKFLCVVNGEWTAVTMQEWQGGSY